MDLQRFASLVAVDIGVEVEQVKGPGSTIALWNERQQPILDKPSQLPRGDA